jgi:hypothetical protein
VRLCVAHLPLDVLARLNGHDDALIVGDVLAELVRQRDAFFLHDEGAALLWQVLAHFLLLAIFTGNVTANLMLLVVALFTGHGHALVAGDIIADGPVKKANTIAIVITAIFK